MSLPGMTGIMGAASSAGIGTIVVTVGTDASFDPKSGFGNGQYGYANSSNSISGGTVGSRSPTTLLGATINAIYSLDDLVSPGTMRLILNGNQTALAIGSVLINGHLYAFSGGSFSGGQTTWTATMAALGNQWGGTPANAVFF